MSIQARLFISYARKDGRDLALCTLSRVYELGFRNGSFATGSSPQEVRRCQLCLNSD